MAQTIPAWHGGRLVRVDTRATTDDPTEMLPLREPSRLPGQWFDRADRKWTSRGQGNRNHFGRKPKERK